MVAQDSEYGNHIDEMKAAQYEKLKFEVEKLKVEIENLRSKWNRATKYVPLITLLIAVGSFWFGFYQVFSEYQRARELSEKEFRRKFYEKQMEVYFKLSETAAKLSTIEDPNQIQPLHQNFMELYYGDLNVVQDKQVEDAAEQFKKSLNEFMSKQGSREKLQEDARNLAKACRNSFRDVWNIPFLYH
jgi:hypothetical protein